MIQKNDKGEVLVHMIDVISEHLDNYTRYNGGWVKKADGVNREVTGGYSILGDFIKANRKIWLKPGLYIDCSKGGSRNRQDHYHTLFELTSEGTVNVIKEIGPNNKDWAVEMWEYIENFKPGVILADNSTEKLNKFNTQVLSSCTMIEDLIINTVRSKGIKVDNCPQRNLLDKMTAFKEMLSTVRTEDIK